MFLDTRYHKGTVHPYMEIQTSNIDLQELISHFRMTCWILLGALNHSNTFRSSANSSTDRSFVGVVNSSKSIILAEYIKLVFENLLSGEVSYSPVLECIDTYRITSNKRPFGFEEGRFRGGV